MLVELELVLLISLATDSQTIQSPQPVKFRTLQNYAIVNNTSIQQIGSSASAATFMTCVSRCSALANCMLVSYFNNLCTLFTATVYKYLVPTASSTVGQRSVNGAFPSVYAWTTSYDATLTSYWPIVNNSTQDMIAGNDFKCVGTPISSTDRLGNQLSAVRVNTSENPFNYYYAPAGVYFSGAFSFTAWAKVYTCSAWSRVRI
jgi:hypothetical protein